MSKPRNQVIRKGDRIRVVDPKFLKRVGYPWDTQYVKDHVMTDAHDMAVKDLVKVLGLQYMDRAGKVTEKITNVVAMEMLAQLHFGGNHRTIHTYDLEEAGNKEFVVDGTRRVKTGWYQSASGGSAWDDYEPACLMDEKTHVILGLYRPGTLWCSTDLLEIEAVRCEKIMPPVCPNHKRYKALRPPTSDCPKCWDIYRGSK
jgi:hypothetical protein